MTAPDELVIEVTAEDIRLGTPASACQCAIALAALRALGEDFAGFLMAEAAGDEQPLQVSLYENRAAHVPYAVYPLPPAAVSFIGRFDHGRPVEPFTFTAQREEATS